MDQPIVVVFGSSRTVEARHLESARRLGRLLAEAGYAVGTGGYAAVMDAVSRGASEAGGRVIGYTSDEFPDAEPTPWLDEERRAPDLYRRFEAMLTEGAAFIALWGGIGTLGEVLVTWNVAQIAMYNGGTFKPLVLVGDNWPPLVDCIGRHTEVGNSVLAYPALVASVEEAADYLRRTLQQEGA